MKIISETEHWHERSLPNWFLRFKNYLLDPRCNPNIASGQESSEHAFKRVLKGCKIFYVRHEGKFVAGISTEDAQTGDYVFDPRFLNRYANLSYHFGPSHHSYKDRHSNKYPSFLLRRCGERFTDQKDQRQVFRIIGSSFIQDIAEWWGFDQEVILL